MIKSTCYYLAQGYGTYHCRLCKDLNCKKCSFFKSIKSEAQRYIYEDNIKQDISNYYIKRSRKLIDEGIL